MWQTALLALLQFGVFRAASAASVHDGPIFAFVAFDKVGSTSLRQILRTREKLHNHSGVLDDHAAWDTDREDGIAHPICDPIVDQFKGGCQDVDNYASVNIGAHDVRGFHFCERQRRPCRYFTLLRHPIERLRSAHSYFCEGCKEGGRQCVGGRDVQQWGGALTCPNMSLAAYARAIGPVYTRTFAHKAEGEPLEGPLEAAVLEIVDLTGLGRSKVRDIVRRQTPTREAAYRALDQYYEGSGPFRGVAELEGGATLAQTPVEAADAWLQGICTLLIEPGDSGSPTLIAQLARWMGDRLFEEKMAHRLTHKNVHEHGSGTRAADAQVAAELSQDIELYRRVKERFDRGESCTSYIGYP